MHMAGGKWCMYGWRWFYVRVELLYVWLVEDGFRAALCTQLLHTLSLITLPDLTLSLLPPTLCSPPLTPYYPSLHCARPETAIKMRFPF